MIPRNDRVLVTAHHPHPALRATFPQGGKEYKGFPSPLGRGQGEGPDQLRILSELTRELSPSRVRHCRSVARWATVLARLHGADLARAEQAGWLHDLAKEWRSSRLASYVRAHKIAVPHLALILDHTRAGLLHGYVSAHLARRRGLVRDRQTLAAMARHTLGHVRMGLLDKILYVADFSSPDRRYAEAARVRRLARRDLEAALRLTVSYKIADVVQRSGFLHPTTVALWNELCKS